MSSSVSQRSWHSQGTFITNADSSISASRGSTWIRTESMSRTPLSEFSGATLYLRAGTYSTWRLQAVGTTSFRYVTYCCTWWTETCRSFLSRRIPHLTVTSRSTSTESSSGSKGSRIYSLPSCSARPKKQDWCFHSWRPCLPFLSQRSQITTLFASPCLRAYSKSTRCPHLTMIGWVTLNYALGWSNFAARSPPRASICWMLASLIEMQRMNNLWTPCLKWWYLSLIMNSSNRTSQHLCNEKN